LNQLILIVVAMISTAENVKRSAEDIANDIDLSWLDFNSESGQKIFSLIQSLLPQQNKSVTQKNESIQEIEADFTTQMLFVLSRMGALNLLDCDMVIIMELLEFNLELQQIESEISDSMNEQQQCGI